MRKLSRGCLWASFLECSRVSASASSLAWTIEKPDTMQARLQFLLRDLYFLVMCVVSRIRNHLNELHHSSILVDQNVAVQHTARRQSKAGSQSLVVLVLQTWD